MVAKKDFNAPGHIDLHKIPNLQVIKACQSLTSRGYVKTQFSWQYYYYTLTNEGIGIDPPLVPATASVLCVTTCRVCESVLTVQNICASTCTFPLNWSP